MKHAALGLALLALALLPACTGTAALLRCLAVDHDSNRRCQ